MSVFYTLNVEWILSMIVFVYISVDLYIRLSAIRIAIKYHWPLHYCHDYWITEQMYKDWFLFLKWDRPFFYAVTAFLLYSFYLELVMWMFVVKLATDFMFHRFVMKRYRRFFPPVNTD